MLREVAEEARHSLFRRFSLLHRRSPPHHAQQLAITSSLQLAEKGVRARVPSVQTCGGAVGAGGAAGAEGRRGPCEGKRRGRRCPNPGLLCAREQAGPCAGKSISPKYQCSFLSCTKLAVGWRLSWASPLPALTRIWGLRDVATFQRRGEAGGYMRPSPGQPGTGFHIHSPVVG